MAQESSEPRGSRPPLERRRRIEPEPTSGVVRQAPPRIAPLCREELAPSADPAAYSAVLEDLTEVVSRFRADGTLTFVNEVYCRFFGRKREELLGQQWHPVAVAEDLPVIEAKLRTLSATNPVVVIENRVFNASGEVRWMQFVNRAFFDPSGRLREMQSVGRDITERKRMESAMRHLNETLEIQVAERTAALRSSESQLATQNAALDRARNILLEAQEIAHLGSWEYLTATRSTVWSSEQFRIFGLDPTGSAPTLDEMVARFLIPGDEHWIPKTFMAAVQNQRVYELEHRIRRPDGTIRWIYNRAQPHVDARGELVGYLGTTLDITEQKHAEEALRVLTAQMEEIREQERQRLGRELHDGLSQVLTATKFKIGLLKRQLDRRMPVDASEVGQLENEINQALDQARDMARGLNPGTLLARGLVAALEDLARSMSRTFQMDCVCAAAPVVVADQGVALHLYRIAQEAVQNAVQHAKPRQVVIRLTAREGRGCLEVLDDGLGFSPSDSPVGMGLANLQTRAQAIGGRLEIHPRPGGGTAITCTWSSRGDSAGPTGLVP